MSYSQEQIDRANAVDLADFLRHQGEPLQKSGSEFRWKVHDSVTIKGNKWYQHSQNRGGYPIDFLTLFYGKTFPEAVEMLTGEKASDLLPIAATPAKNKAIFQLPARNETNDNAIRYLQEVRKISRDVINYFIQAGDVYEDAAHHNVVFVGRDSGGVPRYACLRSIREKYRQDVSGSEKAFGFHYRGSDEILCVFEASIDMLSFATIKQDWKKHNLLSLGGVSGKALQQFLTDHPSIRKVYLCLDNDQAGQDACKRLADELDDHYEVLQLIPVLKDWNEILQHWEEVPKPCYCVGFRRVPSPDEKPSPAEIPVPVICMNDVRETEVQWLWKPYIPYGKISLMQGMPGEGKTYTAMNILAACTNRVLLPGMDNPLEPFNVIYQTAEDGLGDTIKPRLMAAGADLTKVFIIDDREEPLSLIDQRIEKVIRQRHVKLCVIDPLQAFLGAKVDMNRANEVRPIFMQLGQVAERTGCAFLLIGHLNKSAGMQSLTRGLGSVDIAASVRSIMFVGKLKQDPDVRILTHEKSSLAPPGSSLAFSLGSEEGFHWIGEYEITSDELLDGAQPKRENKTSTAQALLRTMLADGKQLLSEELERAALEKGIPSRTLRLAKQKMGAELQWKILENHKKVYWLATA